MSLNFGESSSKQIQFLSKCLKDLFLNNCSCALLHAFFFFPICAFACLKCQYIFLLVFIFLSLGLLPYLSITLRLRILFYIFLEFHEKRFLFILFEFL